jgi:hypothetical protein
MARSRSGQPRWCCVGEGISFVRQFAPARARYTLGPCCRVRTITPARTHVCAHTLFTVLCRRIRWQRFCWKPVPRRRDSRHEATTWKRLRTTPSRRNLLYPDIHRLPQRTFSTKSTSRSGVETSIQTNQPPPRSRLARYRFILIRALSPRSRISRTICNPLA